MAADVAPGSCLVLDRKLVVCFFRLIALLAAILIFILLRFLSLHGCANQNLAPIQSKERFC